jgi:hypothetical protein
VRVGWLCWFGTRMHRQIPISLSHLPCCPHKSPIDFVPLQLRLVDSSYSTENRYKLGNLEEIFGTLTVRQPRIRESVKTSELRTVEHYTQDIPYFHQNEFLLKISRDVAFKVQYSNFAHPFPKAKSDMSTFTLESTRSSRNLNPNPEAFVLHIV